CSIAGIAKTYEDFLDLLVCDTRDARAAIMLRENGLRVQCTETIMRTADDKAALARTVLSFAMERPSSDRSVSEKSAARATVDQP
ncbi:MAG: hypothetical protein WBM24_15570, partial [Candidatus Sulfotelmatobacter sp.]